MINNDLNRESYIPIKPNASGGMAIMFAMSMFMITSYLLQILAHHFPVGFLKIFEKGCLCIHLWEQLCILLFYLHYQSCLSL